MYTTLQKNSNIEALLQLEKSNKEENNWSKGLILGFERHNFDQLPYYQTQIFEDSILYELSVFSDMRLEDIKSFNYELTGENIKIIKWLLDNIEYVTPVQKLNLTFALTSLSRYELAEKTLKSIDPSTLLNHEKIYYFLQLFIIKNRNGKSDKTANEEFQNIRFLLQNYDFPETVNLFFSGQAIVWYEKEKFIENDLFNWYLNLGLQAAEKLKDTEVFSELHALSNFYRAYAMVQASDNNIELTRDAMEKCFKFADKLVVSNEITKVIKNDTLKTYYESTIKEHLYLTKDLVKAEDAAKKLVELDPNWSISHQELGDVFLEQGYIRKALDEYKIAKELTIPRYSVSLYKEAHCLELLGNYEEAIESYKDLLKFDPLNITAGINGLKLSREIKNLSSEKFFFRYTVEWKKRSDIPNDLLEALN